jgi:tripartite-type tricarboxylate transporter receptor subunit TctC
VNRDQIDCSPPRVDECRSVFGSRHFATREPGCRPAAHRNRPADRAGRCRRQHGRDGPNAGSASADSLGPVRDRGEPLRRWRHHRHNGGRRNKGDGHTILVGNPGPNAIAYSIFRNLNYKADQLQAVSNLIRIPNIVSAHPSTEIKSIPELVAYIKANPDKLNYGSSGVGQSPHLTGAWFLQLTGLKMVHVPFRGAGPALQAALGGDIQILFDNLFPSLPQVQDGKLNGLCVTTPERSASAPDLPTMRETAPELAKFDVSSWFGIFLPKSAPAAVVDALNKEIKVFLEREDTKRNIAAMGARTDYGTPQQFSDFVQAETVKFAGIIKQEGLQMDVN